MSSNKTGRNTNHDGEQSDSAISHDPHQPDGRFRSVPENIDAEVHRQIRKTERKLKRQNQEKRPEGPYQEEGMP